MALVLKDRVKETSASSGTGNITLTGAFPGYQTFNTAIASGSTVYYTIHNLVPGFDTEWEVGVGTFTSPATLSRGTVLSSSTGSLINFTAGTEGLEVFVTQPAEEAIYLNQATGLVEVGGNGTNTVSFTNINASNVVMTSGTISTGPSNAADIVNKGYVDGIVAAGVHYHQPVLVESPTALNALYNQPGGAGNGVGATLTNNGANAALVIDGVTLSNTARVLVYTQANAVQNGVYTVTNEGAPDTPGPGSQWVLTRATDADTYVIDSPTGLSEGSTFFVQSGDTGAGETYTCNTTGVITFGTTNITFSQISSAQIYSAGTGLSLTNTTFSISNTAVTAAQYGNDGNVAQITVNAQGQLTNAANVAINASSITTGTLPNAQTTADSANGASTIVLRDANGSFNANVGTFTTVNATTGNFTNITGNAVSLTDINASNITSGTLSNDRTTANTANSASTIVLRDTNGNFGANVISAASFSGDGTAITAINASNISSGTIDNSRTTAASANGASTIVLRDAGGNFSANTITANIAGDISGGTNINASNITSGTISNARTTASSANGASTIVLRDVNGSFDANVVNATDLSGGGTLITSINASNLSAGTVNSARISGSYTGITGVGTLTAGTWNANVIANNYTTADSANGANTIVSRDANGSFSANVVTATTFSGSGASISSINASNLSSGTVATARLASGTANSSTYLRGDSTWAALSAPNNGTLTMNTSGTGLSGSQTFTADQASNVTFTVASNASSANGANTIVARGASGEFSAGAITASSFSGAGTGLTGTASGLSIGGSAASATSATTATTATTANALNTGNNYQVNSLGVGTAASGTAGEIRATNNITAYFSDERLKTKTGNIENALNKVCQIETMLYHANEVAVALGYDASVIEPGVTAQSVQKVQPEVVVPAPIDDKYLTVRYEKLVPLLIEAIKELKAEVDSLKHPRTGG